MNILKTPLEGVLIIEPEVYKDARGCFMEIHRLDRYSESGLDRTFVQDNLSRSRNNVLRGLHFQVKQPQAKLIQATRGAVFDVAVDLRLGSPNFGKWTGVVLSDDNMRQIFIPEGFAHGLCVLSEFADVFYKCTDFYCPGDEGAVRWDDPDIGIDWPVTKPLLSSKDADLPRLKDIPKERLPVYK